MPSSLLTECFENGARNRKSVIAIDGAAAAFDGSVSPPGPSMIPPTKHRKLMERREKRLCI